MPVYSEQIKRPYEEHEYTLKEIKELKLCNDNIFHFLTYVKIIHPDLGRIIFNPYDFQKEMLQLLIENRFNVLLVARQMGKSLTVGIYALHYAIFNPDKVIGIVSNKESSAIDFLSRIKIMYEELPKWLKCGVVEYNKKSITFENGTVIVAGATSKNAFRGKTCNVIISDELAFIEPGVADDFYMSNYPTISVSKTSKFIAISTPNGVGGLFYELYMGAKNKTNNFVHFKADWRRHPDRNKKWAETELGNIGRKRFDQEYDIKFIGSANTVLDKDTLLKLSAQKLIDPILYSGKDRFRIYEKPIDGAQYCLGCLPVGENVLTDKGIKTVESVSINDKLIDINGNITDINNIQLYKDVNDDVYEVSTYCNFRTTKFTSEHPIYYSHTPKTKRMHGKKRYRDFNFEYDKVANLSVNDWVKYPNIYRNKELSYDTINSKWCYQSLTRKDFVMNSPLLDKDFWWFIGVWLGDGWIQQRNNSYSIHTCHNAKTEKHFADKIRKIFSRYGRSVSIVNRKSNTIETTFSSKELGIFLINTFGRYAGGKFISEWIKYLPNKFKYQLIKGYIDSDGCVYKQKNRYTIHMVSISLKLLEDIQDILNSVDILSSLCKLRDAAQIITFNGKLSNRKETYQLSLNNFDSLTLSPKIDYDVTGYTIKRDRNKRYCHFSDDNNYIYYKIRTIVKSNYKGDVYNFETSTHSFLSRGIPTHNCDCAKGTGEHYSTIQVLRIDGLTPLKLEQVAVFEDNFTDTYEFAQIIVNTSYYYNNAYIMAENNGEGSAVISEIWWNHECENLVCEGSKITKLGIRATSKTKPIAVLLMKKIIENESIIINDFKTIQQFLIFIDKGNNRFAGNGGSDDLISALYWATYIFEMDILDDTKTFTDNKEEFDDEWGNIFHDVGPEIEEGYTIVKWW